MPKGIGYGPKRRQRSGGLVPDAARLQREGRGGDTLLAHITEREAQALHGSTDGASVNPRTGLLEFFEAGDDFGGLGTPEGPADTGGAGPSGFEQDFSDAMEAMNPQAPGGSQGPTGFEGSPEIGPTGNTGSTGVPGSPNSQDANSGNPVSDFFTNLDRAIQKGKFNNQLAGAFLPMGLGILPQVFDALATHLESLGVDVDRNAANNEQMNAPPDFSGTTDPAPAAAAADDFSTASPLTPTTPELSLTEWLDLQRGNRETASPGLYGGPF